MIFILFCSIGGFIDDYKSNESIWYIVLSLLSGVIGIIIIAAYYIESIPLIPLIIGFVFVISWDLYSIRHELDMSYDLELSKKENTVLEFFGASLLTIPIWLFGLASIYKRF